jgi:hypothetical protein
MSEQQDIVNEEVPVEQEAVEEPTPLPSVEELAAQLGHTPREAWIASGKDPAKWRDPVDYIKHGQNDTLVKKLAAIERSHEQLVRTTAATTKRLLDEQAAEINARWQQAVEDGDHKAVRAAEREMQAVEAQRQAPDPMIADFQARNSWYGTDPDATDYAAAISQRLAAQGKSAIEQLEAAERGVRKRFPELFEQEEPQRQQRQAPAVHQPQSRTAVPPKRGKTAADLPREVRQIGEEMVRAAKQRFPNSKYSIEDYARTYFQETGAAA